MESIILITMLIVTCVIIAICIGEINTTARENKQLKSDLITVERDKETLGERLEDIEGRLEDEKRKRQEAERKLRTAEDSRIQGARIANPIVERKRLAYRQAIRHWEVDDLEKATNYAAGAMLQNVVDDLQKYIVKEEDVRHCETIYSLDIWV